jgi:hypothetical protein
MLNPKTILDPELRRYCQQLKAVNLALSDMQEDIVLDFLSNPYSGYPQLLAALLKILKGRRLKGVAVPIDNIKASYQTFYNGMNHAEIEFFDEFTDLAVLKAALAYRWKEKQPQSPLNSFEEIAPRVPVAVKPTTPTPKRKVIKETKKTKKLKKEGRAKPTMGSVKKKRKKKMNKHKQKKYGKKMKAMKR